MGQCGTIERLSSTGRANQAAVWTCCSSLAIHQEDVPASIRDLTPRHSPRIFPAAALLGALWMALPIQLQRSSAGSSLADCLTLSDTPPAGRPGVLLALERCAVLLPTDTQLMADLGAEYEAVGRLVQAEGIYQHAITIDPEYADLRLRLGRLMMRRGAAAEAQLQAKAGLRTQPNRKALLDLLGQATRALARS
jgi:tetratricopeptide (TPR) repeat protein